MSHKRAYGVRIQELQERMHQLKQQEVELKKRQAAEEKKQRTKLLTEIGGAVEAVLRESLGDDDGKIMAEDLPTLITFLQQQEARGGYFSKAIVAARTKDQA